MNDRHDDDENDPRRNQALQVARRALAGAPVHSSHRHGVVVGIAVEPDGPPGYIAVIAVVQGIEVPCWIVLDDDDLDRIAFWTNRQPDHADHEWPN